MSKTNINDAAATDEIKRPLIARIAVDAATTAIDKPYDYIVPAGLRAALAPGCRVLVPFGRSNKKLEGIVLSLFEGERREGLKAVFTLLDEKPVIDNKGLRLAAWLRDRYFCTLYDSVRVMLPAGLWFSLEETYEVIADKEAAYEAAGDDSLAATVLAALFAGKGSCKVKDMQIALGGKSPVPVLKKLEERGIVKSDVLAKRGSADKTVKTASLIVNGQEAYDFAVKKERTAPMQSAAAKLLAAVGEATIAEISYFSGASAQSVMALEKAGLIELSDREVYRQPAYEVEELAEELVLNPEQQAAYSGIRGLIDEEKPAAALLYGVTGSGKTSVYIQLIKHVLEKGKSALVLVPEIALTPQLLSVFGAHFGDSIAVMHSSLRTTERYDEWKRIKYSGKVKVVVGTRSAVFSPLANLGLIIIDEEQEHTYKSEMNPRYHARDVAKYRCQADGCVLLLGSATPSIESSYYASTGRYSLFSIKNRYNRMELPAVHVVDMKEELKAGNAGALSGFLVGELRENIARGEQSILFLNRRGNSKLMACGECGYVHHCPNCSVAMTYHSANGRLMCHYCGHSEKLPEACPQCGGRMKYAGCGTQKVEEELEEIFPGVPVIRMDSDTVGATGSHDRILKRFAEEKIPIMVGTQMVAKGLDFESVTLVGVVSADMYLYMDDYRAYERSFSLMAQAVGRAGRGARGGRAVIQTLTPENEVIRLAARQDYPGFYKSEIELRRANYSPPFCDILSVFVSGPMETEVLKASAAFRQRLRECVEHEFSDMEMDILGPAPLFVARINNRYRYRLTLICKNDKKTRGLIAALLKEFKSDGAYKNLAIYADSDD